MEDPRTQIAFSDRVIVRQAIDVLMSTDQPTRAELRRAIAGLISIYDPAFDQKLVKGCGGPPVGDKLLRVAIKVATYQAVLRSIADHMFRWVSFNEFDKMCLSFLHLEWAKAVCTKEGFGDEMNHSPIGHSPSGRLGVGFSKFVGAGRSDHDNSDLRLFKRRRYAELLSMFPLRSAERKELQRMFAVMGDKAIERNPITLELNQLPKRHVASGGNQT